MHDVNYCEEWFLYQKLGLKFFRWYISYYFQYQGNMAVFAMLYLFFPFPISWIIWRLHTETLGTFIDLATGISQG